MSDELDVERMLGEGCVVESRAAAPAQGNVVESQDHTPLVSNSSAIPWEEFQKWLAIVAALVTRTGESEVRVSQEEIVNAALGQVEFYFDAVAMEMVLKVGN